MSQYYPKPYEAFSGDIKVKVDLSNYAIKADIKNISHVDTSGFALQTNLANLKTELDKLDVDKLVPAPDDLSKLSHVVANDVVKKTDYNNKITEIEGKIPNTSTLATKTTLTSIENKIPDTSSLVKKTDYNTKITEIEGKIPDISNLATKTALIFVENKIPDITNLAILTALTNLSNTVPDISALIKKSDYDTKIREIENKFVSDTGFDSNLEQANVITKENFDAKVNELENNIKNLQTLDSSYFRGKNYLDEDGKQSYLVFLPIIRYFRLIANTKYISSWKSKGLSNETITPYATSDNSLTPWINYYGTKIRLQFTKSCLKQPNKLTYDKGRIVNVYIVYERGASSSNVSDPIIKNCLFDAVTLTKNADIDKYKYSGYGIGFDRISSFSFPGGGFGQNIIILGADMNSSIHVDNKGKYILILGKAPTQGLGKHSLTAEKMYSINFTLTKKRFCLSLSYNGANSYLFVNGTEIHKF